jgi:hypothetical protein
MYLKTAMTVGLTKPFVYFFCASLLFLGCAAKMKRKVLDEPYQSKSISVGLTITDIEVADARTSVDVNPIVIPSFTFKTVGDTIVPPLTTAEERILKDEIAHYAKGGGTEVRVRATIKKGVKQYSKGILYAREYAQAAVEVELLDTGQASRFFSATGEADYEIKSTKADSVSLETLYVKALKTCVFKAFESVEEYLEKQVKEESPGSDSNADEP